MLYSLQHPAGASCPGRKKWQCIFIWFIIIGIARESFHAAEANGDPKQQQSVSKDFHKEISGDTTSYKKKTENASVYENFKSSPALDRILRSVPDRKATENISTENIQENNIKLDSIQKSPLRPKSIFIFPYYRPGRTDEGITDSRNNENQNSDSLSESFDMSNDFELLRNSFASKKHDTVIPMVRFGRTNGKKKQINRYSVIPYPRLGRSDSQNEYQINDYINEENEADVRDMQIYISGDRNKYPQEIEDVGILENDNEVVNSQVENYDPFDAFSEPESELFENENKDRFERNTVKSDRNFILPQMRYGRSLLLLPPPKTEETEKQKSPQTFVLPYPRPGRSNKYQFGNYKTEHLILPYLRPGRSDNIIEIRKKSSNKGNQGYMLPSARLGRSALDTIYEVEGKTSLYSDDEGFLALRVNPLLLKSEERNLSEKPKDKSESSSVFIIPYPRPGKKSVFKLKNENPKSSDAERGVVVDYVLPYPRPGKKSLKEKLQTFKGSNKENPNIQSQYSILPYPRPGKRSSNYMVEEDDEINQTNDNEIENVSAAVTRKFFLDFKEAAENGDEFSYQNDDESNSDLNESSFEIFEPEMFLSEDTSDHLRLKRSTSVVPYPRLGRSGSVVPYPRLGRSGSVVPYPRLGRTNDPAQYPRIKKSNSVVPYPRLGRSNFVVPYLRTGKSGGIVPYPRPGRSEAVVPYPRLGRSGIVPYPRPGRSDSVLPYPRPGRSNVLLPYPRPGRSSLVPYPRPGRSEAVVPYPRPGRSGVVPYPRPGRSNAIVPYPRPGRSGVVPYPRPGRSNVIVPYPRPGRSGVVPYPRPGRSNSVVPYPRPGRSDVVPYPRPGRSDSVVPYPRPGRSNVVPYPRPGRSDSLVPYPRPGRSDSVVPYPRTGRSASEKIPSTDFSKTGTWLLPNIRPGRSYSEREDIYVVPYPRPGRSEVTNNELSNEQFRNIYIKKGKDVIIPYPRLGRSKKDQGYILPHPRTGRSKDNIRNKRDTFDTDTVIPYPRLGRSQKPVTPSQDVVNTVHKLNKHMLTNVDDSIYILPYPRPGRVSE